MILKSRNPRVGYENDWEMGYLGSQKSPQCLYVSGDTRGKIIDSKVPVEVGTKSILHHNYFDLKIGALRIKTGSNANSTRSSH